ncbi:MAG: ATP-binding cassette domain-containing protein [Actinomycetota bacterium]
MTPELIVRGAIERGELAISVDLALGPGVTALIGANGAGKTSLLRTIAGLDALRSGSLTLDDRLLDAPAEHHFVPPEDRDVAMAFQEPRLFPHLSVLDNIAYPARRRGRPAPTARDDARRLAASMGLDQVIDLRPSDLSGGQAQRVNVARALAANASTLLLDEPLASIDDGSREELRNRLRQASPTRTVWVTHDPTDLSHADRVISLDDVVQTGRR